MRSDDDKSVVCAKIHQMELFESELFGYEKGAFTGASSGGKRGLVEEAENGTLFLDEIGDMPLPMQAKLLRVLQEREVERVGGTSSRRVDIRIIAATGRPIEELVGEGTFRADLYYRIHVIPVHIPPLKDRREDIGEIAEHSLAKIAADTGEPRRRLSPELLGILRSYAWPGNVRELQNDLERAVAMARGELHLPEHLPPHLLRAVPDAGKEVTLGSLASAKAEAERSAILAALKASRGNKTKAADILRIHRVKLYEKMKRHGIDAARNR